MHEWGFKQYRKRPPTASAIASSSASTGGTGTNAGKRVTKDTRRDVRAVDKFVELALILDQAMVRIDTLIDCLCR